MADLLGTLSNNIQSVIPQGYLCDVSIIIQYDDKTEIDITILDENDDITNAIDVETLVLTHLSPDYVVQSSEQNRYTLTKKHPVKVRYPWRKKIAKTNCGDKDLSMTTAPLGKK